MKKSIIAFFGLISVCASLNLAQASNCGWNYHDISSPTYVSNDLTEYCCDLGYDTGFKVYTTYGGYQACDAAFSGANPACVHFRAERRAQCATPELYPAYSEGWTHGLRAGRWENFSS